MAFSKKTQSIKHGSPGEPEESSDENIPGILNDFCKQYVYAIGHSL
jgi:hypothetical protein